MSSTQLRRVFGLDLLRAIAILLVIISHITYLIFPNSESSVILLFRIVGAIGVDLFFVLSGFLIGGILLKKINANKTSPKDLLHFWNRRWFRTLPNYFLILGLNYLLVLLVYGTNEPIVDYLFFVQNFVGPHPDFFTEAWSLSIEEYAYLILPLLVFACFKLFKNKGKTHVFIVVTIASIILLQLVKLRFYLFAEINSYKDWSSLFRKVVLYRIDAIYLGFLLIYMVKKYALWMAKYKRALFLGGLILIMSVHFIIFLFNILPQNALGFYVFGYLQITLIGLSMLFPMAKDLVYHGKLLKTVRFLSIHSYAIYLVNYSMVLLSIQNMFAISEMQFLTRIGFGLFYLTVSLVLSKILYACFELPILRYRDRKFPRVY